MKFLYVTFLYSVLSLFPDNRTSPLSCEKIFEPNAANLNATDSVYGAPVNVVLQSKDGGQTWQDISRGLPGKGQVEGLFVGKSELYMRVGNEVYRSNNSLSAPVWEKENTTGTSIAFNRSGVMAYTYDGQVFRKIRSGEDWLPVYKNLKMQTLETVFETSDGTVFAGFRKGLYKSADKGQTWKQVHNEGWVMDLAESGGVLVAAGQRGIMRSTDNGEHWEWVISEGGVGIDVEHINGGFAAISYNSSTQARSIRISLDHGKTWESIDKGLRPSLSISSITQLGNYLICGHPDGIFRSSDMGKTWNVVHPTFQSVFNMESDVRSEEGKVFRIYASGNVLYAVLKDSGC